jgi:hypothetical protein
MLIMNMREDLGKTYPPVLQLKLDIFEKTREDFGKIG